MIRLTRHSDDGYAYVAPNGKTLRLHRRVVTNARGAILRYARSWDLHDTDGVYATFDTLRDARAWLEVYATEIRRVQALNTGAPRGHT